LFLTFSELALRGQGILVHSLDSAGFRLSKVCDNPVLVGRFGRTAVTAPDASDFCAAGVLLEVAFLAELAVLAHAVSTVWAYDRGLTFDRCLADDLGHSHSRLIAEVIVLCVVTRDLLEAFLRNHSADRSHVACAACDLVL